MSLASVFLCGDEVTPSKTKATAIPSAHQTTLLKSDFSSPFFLQKNVNGT